MSRSSNQEGSPKNTGHESDRILDTDHHLLSHPSPISLDGDVGAVSAVDPPPAELITQHLGRLISLVGALNQTDQSKRAEKSGKNVEGREEQTDRPGGDVQEWDRSRLNPKSADSQSRQASAHRSFARSHKGDPPSKSPDGEFALPSGAQDDDLFGDLNVGYLNLQDDGRSKYVSTTYWGYVSDQLDQLSQLLSGQNRNLSSPVTAHEDCQLPDCSCSPGFGSDTNSSPRGSRQSGVTYHDQASVPSNEYMVYRNPLNDISTLFKSPEADSTYSTLDSREMLERLPSKSQSHVLFRCWFSGVQSFFPLLHPSMVLEKYQEFWEWHDYRKGLDDPLPDPQFIPLLYSIWYGGSVSISLEGLKTWFNGTERGMLSNQLHDQVIRCLTITSFPHAPSTPSLAAFLTLLTIRETEEETFTIGLYLGLALRVAQSMGLHRDPELFGLTPWEVEARRRIWWHITHMDGALALASGLPALVPDDEFCDTKDGSETRSTDLNPGDDSKVGTTRPFDNFSREERVDAYCGDNSSTLIIRYIVSRGKHILSNSVRRLLKIQLGTRRITRKDMDWIRSTLRNVERDLQEVVKIIPADGKFEMGFSPNFDQTNLLIGDTDISMANEITQADLEPTISPEDCLRVDAVRYHTNCLVAFYKWFKVYLSLTLDKLYCMSYQPFLKSSKSTLWPLARPSALRHCHNFMRKFISLSADPQFQPFQWKRPGTHQPMHPSVILLVDLYERPNSEEAPISRALIDKFFSISEPGGMIANDGEETITSKQPRRESHHEEWSLLRRLREKAWQKAGLDPKIFWTKEMQVQTGVAWPSGSRFASQGVLGPLQNQAELKTGQGTGIVAVSQLPQPPGLSTQKSCLPGTGNPFTRQSEETMDTTVGDDVSAPRSQLIDPIVLSRALFDPSKTEFFLPTGPQETFHLAPSVAQPTCTFSAGVDSPGKLQEDGSPQFDWNEWDAVFGQHVLIDSPIDFMSWEGPDYLHSGSSQGSERSS